MQRALERSIRANREKLHIAEKLGDQELTLAQRIANEDLKGIRHNYGK